MDALASSKCLILPSYGEGYPLVILESLSQGIPVLATDVGGIPDLLGDTEGTQIIEKKSTQALINGIEDFLCKSQNRASNNVKKALKSRFNSINSPNAINHFLDGVLQKGCGQA